jgi:hypothetical protein
MKQRERRNGAKRSSKKANEAKRRTKIMVRVSNESASTHHRWEETSFTMTEVDIEK